MCCHGVPFLGFRAAGRTMATHSPTSPTKPLGKWILKDFSTNGAKVFLHAPMRGVLVPDIRVLGRGMPTGAYFLKGGRF